MHFIETRLLSNFLHAVLDKRSNSAPTQSMLLLQYIESIILM